MKGLLVFALALLLRHWEVEAQGAILGPAEVTIKNVEQCEDPDRYLSKVHITRRKLNRTHDVFDGNVTLHTDWDDRVSLYMNVAKWGDGGYKPNYFILDEKKSCAFLMEKVEDGFKKILRESNMPEKCPIKKGALLVKNYLIDYTELPGTLIYGDFRMDINFKVDGVATSCIKAYAISKPKQMFPG